MIDKDELSQAMYKLTILDKSVALRKKSLTCSSKLICVITAVIAQNSLARRLKMPILSLSKSNLKGVQSKKQQSRNLHLIKF